MPATRTWRNSIIFGAGFFVVLAFSVAKAQAIAYSSEVYISEFLPDPSGDDATLEFIEIYNESSEAVELSSWRLENGTGKTFTIPNNTIIPSGGYMAFYSSQTGSMLANTGDRLIRLLDPNNILHEEAKYTGSKEGYSYSRDSFGTYTQSSTSTPNAENKLIIPTTLTPSLLPTPSASPSPTAEIPVAYSGSIRINEFLPDPIGDDTTLEFIEIYNTSGEQVDLSGWIVDDVEQGGSSPYIIPPDTIIPANGFVILYRTQTHISLNNDSDHVRLLHPDGVIQDDISYDHTAEGRS